MSVMTEARAYAMNVPKISWLRLGRKGIDHIEGLGKELFIAIPDPVEMKIEMAHEAPETGKVWAVLVRQSLGKIILVGGENPVFLPFGEEM